MITQPGMLLGWPTFPCAWDRVFSPEHIDSSTKTRTVQVKVDSGSTSTLPHPSRIYRSCSGEFCFWTAFPLLPTGFLPNSSPRPVLLCTFYHPVTSASPGPLLEMDISGNSDRVRISGSKAQESVFWKHDSEKHFIWPTCGKMHAPSPISTIPHKAIPDFWFAGRGIESLAGGFNQCQLARYVLTQSSQHLQALTWSSSVGAYFFSVLIGGSV